MKLRLARPLGSDSTSTSDDELRLARPLGSDSASTPEDGLRLARPLGSDSASTSEDSLRLARPQGSDSTSTLDNGLRLARPPGLELNLDLGRRSPPRPTLGARTQPRPRTTVSASPGPWAQTQPRPRRSLRLARPQARIDHVTGGAIITLPLASSSYGEQDRRPIWLAPVKHVMMAPRMLHDGGDSQPLTEARRRQQGPDSSDSCTPTGLRRSSDGHDIA
jgi:hypothetical protein